MSTPRIADGSGALGVLENNQGDNMNIEYQITFQRIEDMIQEQLALSPISHTKPIDLPQGKLSLEHIELGATRLRGHYGHPQRLPFENSTGHTEFVTRKLRFEQDIMAHITPKTESAKGDKADVPVDIALPLVLELDVSMELTNMPKPEPGGSAQLHMTPSATIAIELVGIIGMPTKDSWTMPAYRTTVPLDVHTISTLLGSTKPVTGAAIVASKEYDFVAIRIQLGQLDDQEEAHWADFLESQITPRLRGRQWAMFVDRKQPKLKINEPAEPETVTAPGDEAAFLRGVQQLWRGAVQQASSVALTWLTRNGKAAHLIDMPAGMFQDRVPSETPQLELLPELAPGRAEIVVMRLG